ncbi:MAG: sigma-54-dependent Fis family transcriptional regulator [Nitrospirae bacterium]|nr:sigma-54-dependent Fis family transcriptional regulator [Nitrospirota bacterium]
MGAALTGGPGRGVDLPARVLVVDDEVNIRGALQALLSNEGYVVTCAEGMPTALGCLEEGPFEVVITDLRMTGQEDGYRLLREAKGRYSDTEVIILTAYGTVAGAVEAVKAGAHDYLEKPIDKERLLLVVKKALERRRLVCENRRLALSLSYREQQRKLLGESAAIRAVLEQVRLVAPTNATVLILGESGSGKELVARLIHDNSPRRGGPFVPLNCGALSETLIESELFGHEKGAFTGASAAKSGLLDAAHEGTLFLDEVGAMSEKTQVDLLRVLEQRTFRRVGGVKVIPTSARFVAATNRDLWESVAAGRFREDLYYRFNVFSIHVPPLRERQEDIPLLAQAFLGEFVEYYGQDRKRFTTGALRLLSQSGWPGNVRQLRHVCERLVISVGPETIAEEDVARELAAQKDRKRHIKIELGVSLKEAEKEIIRGVLAEVTSNREEASKILGISPRALYYKLRRHGLVAPGGGAVEAAGIGEAENFEPDVRVVAPARPGTGEKA